MATMTPPPGKRGGRRVVHFSVEDKARREGSSLEFGGTDGEIVDRWWRESSSDLQEGLEVSDDDTTIPAPLLDELFEGKPKDN